MTPPVWLQRFLALGAALVCLQPAWVRAEPRNDVSVYASVGALVTDNVRNASKTSPAGPPESDFAFTYSAGGGFGRRFPFGRATLKAGLTGSIYGEADELNDPLADAEGELEMPIGGRFKLTLSDRFTPAPISFLDTASSRFNSTQTNRALAVLEYAAPLAGAWRAHLRTSGERLDVFDTNNVFAPGADPDRWTVGGLMEVERRLGRRSSLVFDGSVSHTFFDSLIYNPGVPPLIPAMFEDADYTLVGGGASFHFRPRRQFSLSAGGGVSHYFSDTAAGGDTSATGFGEIDWEPTGRSQLMLRGQIQRSSQLNGLSYKIIDGTLRARHQLTRRLTWKAGLLLRHIYGTGSDPLQDNLFSADTSFSFAVGRYFELAAGYGHTRSGAGALSGGAYSRNTGTLTLGATF